jgi:hypothetical protein
VWHDSARQLISSSSLDVGILLLLLYLLTPFRCSVCSLSLSIYPSIYTTTNKNIRHQHLLLPQVIRRLWVAELPDALPLEYICMSLYGAQSFHVSYLVHTCIGIVVHCQLIISFSTVCLLFSAMLLLLCYNDAMISRLQQRVPAKHLRLVQLLRIRLRQVMLRYRVAWFSEVAHILVVFGRWYPLASLVSSDSFPLLCLFSLTLYLSIYLHTTTNNKHQAPTSSPTTSDPTIVSS